MSNEAMLVDLPGKIGNTKLPHSHSLLPLFEAVINAVHAIEDRQKAEQLGGRIVIRIVRDKQQRIANANALPNIVGFTITDDGIGFTDRNYKSFRTSDSTYKQTRGGKGLGRMVWLKAFKRAEIESTYREGGKAWERKFVFACTEKAFEKHKKQELESSRDQQTTVHLVGYKKVYQKACPKTAAPIARRIIEHCLEFFALKTAPTMVLEDKDESIILNEHFDSDVHIKSEYKEFEVNDTPFKILHVMIKATADSEHVLHFCADRRSVRSIAAARVIPNVETPLYSDSQPFIYAGYISGPYLDERAVNERTRFEISEMPDAGLFSDEELVWPEIIGGTAKASAAYLEPFTVGIKAKKLERITKYVMEDACQYRPLLKHKQDKLDSIPVNIADEKLDIELYKIDQEYDAELRERCAELLAAGDEKAEKLKNREQELMVFTEEWNEHGMCKLARHVAYRKATLRFLYDRLKLQANGKYSLEEAMHEVIFPLKRTSDDLRSDQMNLWLLDEKLAYHFYLASELPFSQMTPIEVESDDRPDLLIFDKPFAFADSDEPFRSIIIVEFKRPERNDYRDDDSEKNPIVQVFDYVDKIRDGLAKDRNGNTMCVGENVPIYAYIVCDITSSLRRQARNSDLTTTPDQDGYFGYNRDCKVYIEVISFKKLLGDAKRRNERFFDELGIGRSCTM